MSTLLDIIRDNNNSTVKKQPKSPGLPAAPGATPDSVPATTEQLIQAYKKQPKPEYSQELLKRFRSTMDSAMTSYGGGIKDSLKIPAAKLTLQALTSYDPAKGVTPQTYVHNSLKRLNRISAQRDNIIHIPENTRLAYGAVRNTAAKLEQRLMRQPTLEELADATGLSIKKLSGIMQPNNTFAASTGEQSSQGTYRDLMKQSDMDDKQYLMYVYNSVDNTDKKIIQDISGMFGRPIKQVNEIAAKLHMSPAAVSQRKGRIQNMLGELRGVL